MNIKKIINNIEIKFKNIDNKINELIINSQSNKQLLTTIDFINKLDISLEEYDLLTDYQNINELSEDDIKKLIRLNDELNKKLKYIDLINEKIILSNSADWKVVNKNTISYLLNKQKNKSESSNVIINVYADNNEDKNKNVSLKSLKLEE